ncbi:Phosphatidylglycerol/phosphatidylinositol transfer protein [Clonorchis sinensis]|uniref:Phosphatidylglycerol/phosphatidylinositol transfer protein n=1 Tax=Clonorchis sinensis TaxID=79923 RepID=A0A419PUE5_CLOSI|nr:Phosphatidylglycerol/phosphatidylinositol transfer protein [Clonorchis sinensis]
MKLKLSTTERSVVESSGLPRWNSQDSLRVRFRGFYGELQGTAPRENTDARSVNMETLEENKLTSSKLTVNSVSVDPCSTMPCVLRRGGPTTVSIVFQANNTAGFHGDAAVQFIKWGIPFPFGLKDPQICGDVKPSCPLQSGQLYTYTKELFISSWYPSVYATVRWRLKNTNGDSMVCVEVPVELG